MEKNQTDLWFSFVRAHRLMIREVESRLAAAKLPAYAVRRTLGAGKWARRHPSDA